MYVVFHEASYRDIGIVNSEGPENILIELFFIVISTRGINKIFFKIKDSVLLCLNSTIMRSISRQTLNRYLYRVL
jgi:hypothetical protein